MYLSYISKQDRTTLTNKVDRKRRTFMEILATSNRTENYIARVYK